MTEIGANFSASTRLLQDMHTRAKDGKIDETDVAALTKTATEDASGLTEDEKQMIASLHEGGASAEVVAKNIAALQALKTKEVTPPAPAQETSPEAAETTEITNVTAHEADANQVDFSGLTLTTEKKNFLSKASFGLFGGKTEYSHQVSIADGNIPTIANPAGIQTDEARQQVERGNLIGMMAPLENELNQALTPSADNDVRKRYAEILSKEKGETVSADSPEVTARIQQLKTKMETFKNTPSSNWTNSTDLTQLMESYNQRPAPQGSALNAGYMASLLGSFYNAADARDSAATVKENLTTGNIQTPATLNELNQKLSSSDQAAREQLSQSVEKTTQFLDKLKELKSSNPSAYQALLNGADESAIELLHTQVAEMKKHLDSNQPISQAQISQGNMMWATMHRMQTGLKFPADVDVQSLQTLAADLEKGIANPDLPAEDKAILDMQLKEVRQQIEQANSPERQALASFKTDLEDSFAGVRSAFSSAQDASFARSSTLSELKHLESTLTTLVASTGISESGKAQLQEQLDATKSAIAQLSAGKNIEFETPQQAEALQKALQGLQSLKPAPETGGVCAVPELPTGLPDAGLSFGDFPGVTANIAGSNPTFDLMSPAHSLNLGMPDYSLDLANYNLGSPTLSTMNLGTPSASSSSDPFNLNLNLDLGLAYNSYSLSNSLGFGLGMGSGLSGTGSITGYGFGGPCVNPPASNSATPAQPSLSDALLKNIGEDPSKVTGPELSPEIKEQQAKTKEIIQSILDDPQAPPEAKQNAYMAQQIIDKPNAQTIQIGGQTHPLPPGTFQTTVDVMNAYQALIDKGVPSQDAVAIMDIAKEAITQNQSPEAIQAALQDIVGSPDAKSALKTLRDSQIQKRVENTAADETSYEAVAGMDITRSVAGRLGLGSGAAAVDIYKADDTAFRRAIQPEADALTAAKAAFLADVKKIAGAQAANINSFEDARNFVSQSRNSSAVSLAGKLDQITSQETSLNRLVESRRNFVDVSRGTQASIDAFREAGKTDQANTLAAIQASYLEKGFLPADQKNTLATLINESRVFAFAAGVGRNQETEDQQDHWGGRVKELVDIQTDQTIPDNVRDQRQGAWLQGVIGDLRQGQLGMFTDRAQMNQILEIFKLPPLGPNETGEDFLNRVASYSPAKTRTEIHNQEALAEANVAVTTYHMTGKKPPGFPPIAEGASPAEVENAIFNFAVDASKAAAVDNAANVTPQDRLNSPDPNVRAAAEGLMRVQTENAQVATDILEMPADERAAAWGAVAEREIAAANILNDLTDVRELSSNRLLEANNQWLAAGGFPPLNLDLGDVGAGGTSGPRGDMSAANLDARTRAAVDEANALADSLDLAPMPSMNSEDIFAEWLSDTLSIIRGADEKMRQAILAQMALKMIDQVISTFYKDKNDENADYHAQQLENISSQRTQQQNQIQLNQMVSGASNSQAVAAVGGAVSGAVRAEGFNLTALQGQSVEQMRQQVRQLVQDFGNNNPSSVTENQVSSILNQFDTILQAGSTPGIADDRAALVGMSELMAAQASRN